MKKQLYLFLLLFCIPFLTQAQNNFKEAYIVTLENDTIHGLANFRSDKLNLSECEFKKDLNSESTKYYPKDLLAYEFIQENKIYISQTVNFDGIKKSTFLEYLVKGVSASLFYYEESEQPIFIIKDIYGDFQIVSKKKDLEMNASTVKKDLSYRTKVYEILQYHPDMLPILNRTEFTRKSMTNAIKSYNDLTCESEGSCIVYKASNKIFLKPILSVYGGVRYTDLNFKQNSSVSPEIGIQFMLSYPRISNSFFFITDIAFSRISKNITEMSHSLENEVYKLSATTFDLNIGLKYIYAKGKFRPGIGLGVGRMFLFNQKEEKYHDYFQFYSNLSLDYILKKSQSIFLQFNYNTELDDVLIAGHNGHRYSFSAQLGYRF